MSLSLAYAQRLACLCLASGAIAYGLGTVGMFGLAPWALRRRSARAAFAVRLMPLWLGAAAVGGLCVPSYVWLEPRGYLEGVSGGLLAVAAAGVGLGLVFAQRALASGLSSWRFGRRSRRRGEMRRVGAERVLVLPAPAPALALGGLLRPRLMVSQRALAELTPAQLELGLAHERAHRRAADNLKRLLLHATPVWGGRAAALERGWERWSEWDADDRAAAGERARALALASALVAVARWAAPPPPSPAPLSCLAGDLEARVERLLDPARAAQAPGSRLGRWSSCLASLLLVWLMLQPTTLLAAHAVLERLMIGAGLGRPAAALSPLSPVGKSAAWPGAASRLP